MTDDERDDRMREIIEKWGLPAILRSITRISRAKALSLITQEYDNRQLSGMGDQDDRPYSESMAWLCIDLDWAAKDFETRISQVGMSQADLRKRDQETKLEAARQRVAELEKGIDKPQAW